MTNRQERNNNQSEKSGKSTTQTIRRQKAIVALQQSATMEKAAEAAGVHAATIYRWMKEPQFQKDLREAGRERALQSTARLQETTAAAVSVLRLVMHDPKAPATSRVHAADTVLKHATKRSEIEDLQSRVTELENRDA